MSPRAAAVPLAVCVALALAGRASAWDTHGTSGWTSIYNQAGTHHERGASATPVHNEHAEIADDALFYVSRDVYERHGTQESVRDDRLVVVDLYASWKSPDGPDVDDAHGDRAETPVEERRLPPIAMWAGLPDFQFTMYDWIAKGRKCPPLPVDAPAAELGRCHVYSGGWLGAGLNTTHFGDLAIRVYERHHAIAYQRATAAAALRTRLEGGNGGALPDGSRWHADYVREAEYMALAYEGVGQHFLQDRVAISHMFSRWGSPSWEETDIASGGERDLGESVAQAMVTGLIHGSQAVFGQPDPVAAPEWDGADLVPMTFRLDAVGGAWAQRVNGVGDYLYADLVDGYFKTKDGDRRLYAEMQRKVVRTCGSDGWRTTISAFGENGAGYGIDELTLSEPDPYGTLPGATLLGENPATNPVCTSGWLRNDTYYTGVRTIAGQTGIVGDIVVVVKQAFEDWVEGTESPPYSVFRFGTAYTHVRWEAKENKIRDEEAARTSTVSYGVESARDGFAFSIAGIRWWPNDWYDVPAYYEPIFLEDLPETDERARSTDAVYGFFNKATTDHWCKDMEQTLKGLRKDIAAETDEARRERLLGTCTYLAERVYKGTDPDYPASGGRYERIGEHLPFGEAEKWGPAYEPVCAYFDGDNDVPVVDSTDSDLPYWMHPGYVSEPGALGGRNLSAQTLENWCERIPVLSWDGVDRERPDRVATLESTDGDRWVEFVGDDLGFKTDGDAVGRLEAQLEDGSWFSFDVWDGVWGSDTGGWSSDNQEIWGWIPGSRSGLPSGATAGMLPHEILAAEPATYPIRLSRPLAPDADPIFLADGAETVGRYELDVVTSYEEYPAADILDGSSIGGFYATWYDFARPETEVLVHGFFRKKDGVYTPLDWPVEIYEGGNVSFDGDGNVTYLPDPDRVSIIIRSTSKFPSGFDDDLVVVFAFH